MGQLSLADGGSVVLLGSVRKLPDDFQRTCEGLLRNNVIKMSDPNSFAGGSFLWITESQDILTVPIVVDLPVHVGPNDADAAI